MLFSYAFPCRWWLFHCQYRVSIYRHFLDKAIPHHLPFLKFSLFLLILPKCHRLHFVLSTIPLQFLTHILSKKPAPLPAAIVFSGIHIHFTPPVFHRKILFLLLSHSPNNSSGLNKLCKVLSFLTETPISRYAPHYHHQEYLYFQDWNVSYKGFWQLYHHARRTGWRHLQPFLTWINRRWWWLPIGQLTFSSRLISSSRGK